MIPLAALFVGVELVLVLALALMVARLDVALPTSRVGDTPTAVRLPDAPPAVLDGRATRFAFRPSGAVVRTTVPAYGSR